MAVKPGPSTIPASLRSLRSRHSLRSLRSLLSTFWWLRWRMLVGGLAGRRRSGWRLVSAWAEVGGAALLWLGSLGGALSLSLGAVIAARALVLGGTGRAIAVITVRVLLGVVSAGFVLFPAMRGARTGTGGRVRLLLLPIRSRTLHGLEVASCLADPWLILVVPAIVVLGLTLLTGVPGLFAALPGGVVALVAGLALFAALVSLSAAASFGVELLFRSRRRAELTALVVSVVFIVVSMVPALIDHHERHREQASRHAGERSAPAAGAPAGPLEPSRPGAAGDGALSPGRRAGGGVGDSGPSTDLDRPDALGELGMAPGPWTLALPSEAYTRALAMAASGRLGAAWSAVGALVIETVLLFALSGVFWRRLTTGTASSPGRRGDSRTVHVPDLPLVRPPVAAVAWMTLRTALRTLPGRMALVSPLVMGVVFVFLFASKWQAAFDPAGMAAAATAGAGADLAGALLATTVCAMGLLATQPLSINQLAADGSGLVMTLQAPLRGEELVRGKALGLGLLAALAAVPASLVVVALRPGALALWPAVVLAAASAACLVAPVFASLSALLPKAVDLSRFGRESQPHKLAGLLALVTTALSFLPAFALGAAVYTWSRSPLATAAAEAAWLVVVFFVSRLALRFVGRLVDARREDVYLALSAD